MVLATCFVAKASPPGDSILNHLDNYGHFLDSVNNAMKYALPNGMPGTIWVRLTPAKNGNPATLSVEDDGIGLVEAPEGAGGLGSEVVNALAMGLNATVARETPRPGEPRPGHRVVLTIG